MQDQCTTASFSCLLSNVSTHDLAGYCLRRRERKIEKNGLACPEPLAFRPLQR